MGESADAVAAAVKDLMIAAGVVGLLFGIVGAVVFGLGDQDTFVSPPEIVAEEFVRAIGHGRIEPARAMLASEAERATPSKEVRRLSTALRSRIGRLDDVRAAVAVRRRDTVIVRAHTEGERGNADLALPLVREHGVWSIAHVSGILEPAHEARAP